MKDGGPAFPVTGVSAEGGYITQRGLSLRDYFAGQALAGIMSNENYNEEPYDVCAATAYMFADAMLAAREEG